MENTNQEPITTGEKTFTQEDVNGFISKRLAEDRAKREAEISRREKAVAEKELLYTAKSKLAERKLPAELNDILKYNTVEELDTVLDTLCKVLNVSTDKEPLPRIVAPTSGSNVGATDPIRAAMGLKY